MQAPWRGGCGTAKVSSRALLKRSPIPPPPGSSGNVVARGPRLRRCDCPLAIRNHLFIYRLPGGWRKTARAQGRKSLSRCSAEQKRTHFHAPNGPKARRVKTFYFLDSLASVCYSPIGGLVYPKRVGDSWLGKTEFAAGKGDRRRQKSLAIHTVDRVGSFDPERQG